MSHPHCGKIIIWHHIKNHRNKEKGFFTFYFLFFVRKVCQNPDLAKDRERPRWPRLLPLTLAVCLFSLVEASSHDIKQKGRKEEVQGMGGLVRLTIFDRKEALLPLITRLTDPGPLDILILNTHKRARRQRNGKNWTLTGCGSIHL